MRSRIGDNNKNDAAATTVDDKLRAAEKRVAELTLQLDGAVVEGEWWKMQYQTTILRSASNIESALTKVCEFAAKLAGLPAPNLGVDIDWMGKDDPGTSPATPVTPEVSADAIETDAEKANRLLIESANAFKQPAPSSPPPAADATLTTPATIDIVPAPMPAPNAPAEAEAATEAEAEAGFGASPSPVVVSVPVAEASSVAAQEDVDGIDTTGQLQAALSASFAADVGSEIAEPEKRATTEDVQKSPKKKAKKTSKKGSKKAKTEKTTKKAKKKADDSGGSGGAGANVGGGIWGVPSGSIYGNDVELPALNNDNNNNDDDDDAISVWDDGADASDGDDVWALRNASI